MLIIQIIVSILLTALILVQQEGSGLGSAFGGGEMAYHTRQGMEKLLFRATIALTAVFVGLSIYSLVK